MRIWAHAHMQTRANNVTSDMQGMVWGEPERGSAQNGIWKCDGDDSSHGHWQYQFSLHS